MNTEIRGVVTRATGSWYDVLHEGRTIACRIRGRIRLKGLRSTNPVVVGDEVVCTEGGDGEWVIERILPRRNYIIRRASNLSKESHIIAANIDQALLVATLSQPVTAPEFLDRFLATCEAYKIPATILLAKYDLAAADPEAAAAFHATYESAGLPRRRPLDARRHGARRGACARRPAARRSWRATRASASRRSSAHSNPDWRCAREASRRATAKDGIRPPSRPCTPSRAAGS